MYKTLISIIVVFTMTGCLGKMMNPYAGDFNCPKGDNGKCISVQGAYDETTGKAKPKENQIAEGFRDLMESSSKGASPEEKVYEAAVYRKLTSMIKEPVTPMVTPPQIMRGLVLSYNKDKKTLYMPRYVYFMVDEPKFVINNYIRGGE